MPDLEKKVEELAEAVSTASSDSRLAWASTIALKKQLVETTKAMQEITTELKRVQRKILGLEYSSKCCFKMLEDMTKDRKEKHKQHFAFMTVSLKVLEKIAKKLDLEVKP